MSAGTKGQVNAGWGRAPLAGAARKPKQPFRHKPHTSRLQHRWRGRVPIQAPPGVAPLDWVLFRLHVEERRAFRELACLAGRGDDWVRDHCHSAAVALEAQLRERTG